MPCHGDTACALCNMPVCSNHAKLKDNNEYQWLEDGIILLKKNNYQPYSNQPYIKAYPHDDWLMNKLCDENGQVIKCHNGNIALHAFCFEKLDNTPLPTTIYKLLSTVELDYCSIYPNIDLQGSLTNTNHHKYFELWMAKNPEINKQNNNRIDKVIQLFVKNYNNSQKI